MKKIIPAILTNDPGDLKNKLDQIKGLTDWVHIDIMDGKFVNNVSVSLTDLANIQTNLFIEAHLMVLNPENYFTDCEQASVQRIIFHIEATSDAQSILQKMAHFDFQKGLALNPETAAENVNAYLDQIDVVLCMGVHAGFSGQEFILEILEKVSHIKQRVPQIKIGVDGGIKLSNIQQIAQAGSDYCAVNSALFETKDIKKSLKELQAKIQ